MGERIELMPGGLIKKIGHFSEARRTTGAGIINTELRNAIQLKDWLIDHFLENKSDHVTASHILNF